MQIKEKDILIDFANALVETTVSKIFLALDVIGVISVGILVIDDVYELVAFVILLGILFYGQYLVFKRMKIRLAKYEEAKPHLEYTQVRQARMHTQSLITNQSLPRYDVLQVWFRNNPSLPLETSIAKDVTALIRLIKFDQSELFEYHGQWAKSNAPDNVGFTDYLDSVNIAPGYLEAKLFIALKYPSDDECYAFTREGMQTASDGRSSRYKIDKGNYLVRIFLQGIGVGDMYEFTMHNRGSNFALELEPNFT